MPAPTNTTEREIQDELSAYFFHDKPIPREYWLGKYPLDLTRQAHCLHLIAQVRFHARRAETKK